MTLAQVDSLSQIEPCFEMIDRAGLSYICLPAVSQ